MPTAAIRGRSFSPPFAKSSGKSTWKSSSVPIQQRALRSCPSDGSSSAPSPGSIAVAAWPRIGSASTERPWRSCALPQSASCSESSVKKQHDPGQTLRPKQGGLALCPADYLEQQISQFRSSGQIRQGFDPDTSVETGALEGRL